MPEEGVPLMPKEHVLSRKEIARMARLFVKNGVRKVRLTGGEPTIRRDLVEIVCESTVTLQTVRADRDTTADISKLGVDSIGITSNAIALKRKLPALVEAGLTHLNISLDTLDPFKYELMTRRRGWETVKETIAAAERYEGLKVKINCVVIRGLNDLEVPDFVELTRLRNITVRFIEYMPFEDNRWSTAKLVPATELIDRTRQRFGTLEKLLDPASDTTRTWRVPGHRGTFGMISSMTDHFCGGCSRLRVGADGGMKVGTNTLAIEYDF